MKSFHEELEKEFPSTPDSFRQCVNYAVAEHAAGRSRHFRFAKIVIPIAACLTLICGTVAAAELPLFQQWLTELGINGQKAEELIIHTDNEGDIIRNNDNTIQNSTADSSNDNPDTAAQDSTTDSSGENPLFTVTDVYYDGATLMFWAQPGADLTTLNFGDHVYINGTDNRLEYIVETEEGSGIYQCEVTIMDTNLSASAPETLEVTVQVYISEVERQNFTFTVESDKLSSAGMTDDQLLELSYGTVEVCDMLVAPSKVSFRLKWTVYNEEAFEIIYIPEYFYEDSNGIRYTPGDLRMNTFCSPEVYNEETGCLEFEQAFEIQNFDSSSEYITLIPFEGGYNDEGTYIGGTETLLEDMSFTIRLK